MKCTVCRQRKGKRFCPAKNSQICTQCCGEKRVIEINCPADCVYLKSGQSYQWVKQMVSQSQHSQDPLLQKKLNTTRQKFIQVVLDLEATIVKYAANLSSLADEQVLEAITLLKATYQTEERGLIYEHTSENPLAQALLRDLRDRLEEMRRSPDSADSPSLRSSDLHDCLEVLENDIQYHLTTQNDPDNYLKFIKRNHPEAAISDSSQGGLILPG